MPIIDEELFVRCKQCGHEVATGIRRNEAGLRENPPGQRDFTCHRCGQRTAHGDQDYYHRTVEDDRARVDA